VGVLRTDQFHQLSTAFYARVARDPVLRPLFPGKTQHCAIEELTAFLVQFFDGPPEDTQRRWWVSLRESHLRFEIGAEQRDAWMANMRQALREAPIEEPERSALGTLFEHSSAYVVNTGQTPAPADFPLDPDIAQRWNHQLTLDQTVAAIRSGQTGQAEKFRHNRAVFAFLLALMIDSRERALHAYVTEKIAADPALAHTRYNGRTLLHQAAGAGNAAIAKVLLDAGADAAVKTDLGHTPLYCLANEYKSDGAELVRILIRAGAKVDAADGVKRCTALHMAARRGNVAIAQALLNHGANAEARDSQGVTPLGRAVNCKKPAVAALLRQKR